MSRVFSVKEDECGYSMLLDGTSSFTFSKIFPPPNSILDTYLFTYLLIPDENRVSINQEIVIVLYISLEQRKEPGLIKIC